MTGAPETRDGGIGGEALDVVVAGGGEEELSR